MDYKKILQSLRENYPNTFNDDLLIEREVNFNDIKFTGLFKK
jgi:hypothetical protein